jgi:hypothetical protein
MMTNDDTKEPKSANIFYCEICDFKCSKQCNYNRHLLSAKHINKTKMMTNDDKMMTKRAKKSKKEQNCDKKNQNIFKCDCGKGYKYRQGLHLHKKICCNKYYLNEMLNDEEINPQIYDKELIILLIKQNSELIKDNSEFKNIMMEVIKNGTHNTTNSHNKTFNLQLFLNETCKDAMNIMDFVDSIKLQLSDLENIGKIGYVEGISNIITTNLNALDVTKRPVHCADKKREIIYIKDENKWEKEDEHKNKIKKAIKRVVYKSQRLIPEFKEKHPDCLKSSSKFSDQYNKIIVESMGGSGDNDLEKEDKIIKKISQQVIIEK